MSIISSYEPLERLSPPHLLQHLVVGTPQTLEEPDPSATHVTTEGIQNGDADMVGI
jgi:hypothetical protein